MDSRHPRDINVCVHLFSVSAGMLGICLTVIGLIRVMITIRKVNTIADDLLVADALLFLLCCFSAYWALRARHESRMRRLERIADAMFLLAMTLMTAICGFITYAIATPVR